MRVSANIGERLKAIGFVAIILVVMVHMNRMPGDWFSVRGMHGMTLWQVIVNVGIMQALGCLAVPTFFGISGFWLVKDYDGSAKWWWRSVVKRIKTILLPMLIWAAIAVVYQVICYGAVKFTDSHNWHLPPEVMQFWYYRTLFIYVCLSPLVLWILRHFWGGALVMGFWIAAFVGMPGQSEYYMWLNEAAFTGGIWLGLHWCEVESRMAPLYRKVRKFVPALYLVCVVAWVVLWLLHMRILSNRVRYLLIPLGCVNLWIVSPWLVKVLRPVKGVYSLNVFIFAVHFVVLWRIGSLLQSVGFNGHSVSFMIAQFALTVLICIGLGLLMKKFFPKTLVFLSGGRT